MITHKDLQNARPESFKDSVSTFDFFFGKVLEKDPSLMKNDAFQILQDMMGITMVHKPRNKVLKYTANKVMSLDMYHMEFSEYQLPKVYKSPKDVDLSSMVPICELVLTNGEWHAIFNNDLVGAKDLVNIATFVTQLNTRTLEKQKDGLYVIK